MDAALDGRVKPGHDTGLAETLGRAPYYAAVRNLTQFPIKPDAVAGETRGMV
jgi:hypothetical protein